MKSRIVFCSLVLATLALTACGGHDDPPGTDWSATYDIVNGLECE